MTRESLEQSPMIARVTNSRLLCWHFALLNIGRDRDQRQAAFRIRSLIEDGFRPTIVCYGSNTGLNGFLLEIPASVPFQPGTKWAYSAVTGRDILARIVEITSGGAEFGQVIADALVSGYSSGLYSR